ncbi:hypothetical protein F4821DRAFT_279346 [Hypoxylon rubiginosum]|uniref:Uncharacterized protein n=1 Tax=Hypoxylon rubiginosum TaxID=110542 RepID=A0ACC0CY76_9PEZI|nr:hypothetical protein F4821DRAFT_279346 [Hypoxylon rubiginosum]
MKFNQAIFALLALAGAALGAPAVADSSSVDMGQIKWTGDNTHTLEARARGWGERCTPGKGQCRSGLNCYGCLGHRPVCQEGPDSSQCCYEGDRGCRCEVMPTGETE